MQDKLTKQLPWLLAHLIWFLVLPLAVNFFPEEAAPSVLTLLLVLLNPIFCAVTGLMYSLRGGRSLVFLVYPAAGWVGSLLVYYNESAWLYAVLGVFCSVLGLIFGRWARSRRQTEAEKWVEENRPAKKAAPAARQPEGKADAAPTAGYAPRVASKTAAKNAQRAAARKAKERAEKEEKLRQKNAPKKKKKKKGGH